MRRLFVKVDDCLIYLAPIFFSGKMLIAENVLIVSTFWPRKITIIEHMDVGSLYKSPFVRAAFKHILVFDLKFSQVLTLYIKWQFTKAMG